MAAAQADDAVGAWLQWTVDTLTSGSDLIYAAALAWSADGCTRDASPPEGCRGSSEAIKRHGPVSDSASPTVLRRPSAP
jgi:hypothetical protein